MTKAIDTKQELMRQHMISQLLDLGIIDIALDTRDKEWFEELIRRAE